MFCWIFFSDLVIPCASIIHQQAPEYSSCPSLSGRCTSLDGKMRDTLSHCLDIWTFICLRARLQQGPQQDSHSWSSQRHVVVPERSKSWQAARRIQRNTRPAMTPWEGWQLWFEIQSEGRVARRQMTESLWIQFCSCSNTGFYTVSTSEEEGWLIHGQISALEGVQIVLWGWLINGSC